MSSRWPPPCLPGVHRALQVWPELQLHYRFDPQTKAIAMISSSRDQDSGQAYEGQVGLAVEHKFIDWFLARVGYRYGSALDGHPFQENRLLTEETFRLGALTELKLELRTREDFRWLDTGFFVRLRERALLQREFRIGDYAFVPYVSGEIYFDTKYSQFSRYRLIAGVNFPIARAISIEPYFLEQVDIYPSVVPVPAIGIVAIASF